MTKKPNEKNQKILDDLDNNEERLGKLMDALAGHFEKKLKKLSGRGIN